MAKRSFLCFHVRFPGSERVDGRVASMLAMGARKRFRPTKCPLSIHGSTFTHILHQERPGSPRPGQSCVKLANSTAFVEVRSGLSRPCRCLQGCDAEYNATRHTEWLSSLSAPKVGTRLRPEVPWADACEGLLRLAETSVHAEFRGARPDGNETFGHGFIGVVHAWFLQRFLGGSA